MMRNCYVHFRPELLQLLQVWIFTGIIQNTQRTLLITLTPNRDASLSLLRLFSSIRIALTLHGTKSNSVLSLDELAGEAARLDCIWGMLILQESGSGDVMIKDSISQRSVWCDHILLLTDGVSLMVCCHKWQHQHRWRREQGGSVVFNIPVTAGNYIQSQIS